MGKLSPISDGKVRMFDVIRELNTPTVIDIDQVYRSSKGDSIKGRVCLSDVLSPGAKRPNGNSIALRRDVC